MPEGSLGYRLKLARVEKGLTMREAAEVTGVDKVTIGAIERGQRKPHDITLSRLARGYEVPLSQLLEDPAAPSPKGEAPESGQQPKGGEFMSRRASEALGVTEEAHVLSAPARVFTREWFDDLRELCMEMEREGLLNDGERVFSGLVGFIKEYDYSRDRDLERG